MRVELTADEGEAPYTGTQLAIVNTCAEIAETLVEKNQAYGDSAIDPVRVFSSASPREQLLVRLDDKLSRIARGHELGEDVVLDLIGYLVLLRVHDRRSEPGRIVWFKPEEGTPTYDAFDEEAGDMLRAGALGARAMAEDGRGAE